MFRCKIARIESDVAMSAQYLLAQPSDRSRAQRCNDVVKLRVVSPTCRADQSEVTKCDRT
jgi:hypothetical protein